MALVKLYTAPYPIHIHQALNEDAVNTWCNAYGYHTPRDNADIIAFVLRNDAGSELLVYVPEPPEETTYADNLVLIAHEVMHLVQLTWAYVGERRPSMEAEAYWYQHLFGQVLHVYDKYLAKAEHTMARTSEDPGRAPTARNIRQGLKRHVEYFKIAAS